MSGLTTFTSKFRVHNHGVQNSSASRVAKRPRESLVCNQCRISKLRCDRSRPCSNCSKRNEGDVCNYQRSGSLKVDQNRPNVAESRLAHLESLVKLLMQSQMQGMGNGATPIAPITAFPIPSTYVDSSNESRIEQVEPGYVGSTHWSAVLDDIQELKAALNVSANTQNIESPGTPKSPVPGGQLIFGSASNYSLEQIILRYLPPKLETDRLFSIYFQGETFIVPFVHTYLFKGQYQEFWAHPTNPNPLWLSILFSICCLASLIKGATVSSQDLEINEIAESARFHEAAGQCLVLGEYHRPQQFVLEALGLYAQCKSLRSLDPSREAGIVLSLAVRLAYEMGYHRDPDSFGSFTVFEAEMRRRIWAATKHMDLMMSFQLGLPSNIILENCDTKSPRNLADSDFDFETQELPPSRPESESTRLLWFIVKDRQMSHFSNVCRDALSFKEKTKAEILQLDNEIREMHSKTPAILRPRPFSESIVDIPFIVMTRLFIEFIYLKSLCILHRRYMARGDIFSTKSCFDAGKKLVSHFISMYEEFTPGGQLHDQRWMLTSFTMNDFLLGVMVLCLVVHTEKKRGPHNAAVDSDTKSEVFLLLEKAHAICVEKSSASKDALRVSHAVRLVLDKSAAPNAARNMSNDSSLVGLPIHWTTTDERCGVDLVSLSVNTHQVPDEVSNPSFEALDPFSFMGNDFENLDWTFFEPQI